jgi:putative oxidoreductase
MTPLFRLYSALFHGLQQAAGDWLPGLLARLAFGSVLLVYFFNSALTKVGSGFPGFLIPGSGAYAQILPSVAESVSYDTSQIGFFPYGLIVYAGTYAEFLLPLLVVLGLFTRLSALGMIGFIVVMSYVDITFHGLDAKSIGLPFDRVQDAIIADQRLLWLFPLVYLVLRGPGLLSLDGVLARINQTFRP